MNTRRYRFTLLVRFVAFATLASTAVSVQAGLILSFSPSSPTVNANGSHLGSVTIGVHAAADTGTQTLSAYDLFVDIAPSGIAIPAGWTVSTPVEVANFDLFSPSTAPSQGDVRANGAQVGSPAISLTTTPTTLWTFDLGFNANNGATNGSYALSFLTTGNFGVSDSANQPITPVTTNSGSITLENFVATPEPSTLLFFTVAGLGWGGRLLIRRGFKAPEANRRISA